MRTFFESRADLAPRFIEGTVQELEELFGSPLPELPEGQLVPGQSDGLLVELHPSLRNAFRELVDAAYRALAVQRTKDAGLADPGGWGGTGSPASRFEEILDPILTTILERERRLGLLNLFWLAHSKDAAEVIQEFFFQPGIKIDIKYQIHHLLQGTYRNTRSRVWARYRSQKGDKLRYNLGSSFNHRLIECIVDDQLPLTEVSPARLNLAQVLVEQNKRFRVSVREFKEIHSACRERLREGLQRKDVRLMELLRRNFPSIRPELYDDEKSATRILFNSRVLMYLLADFGGLGMKLLGNPILKTEAGARRGWSELLMDYLDLLQAVKRSEAVDLIRQAVTIAGQEHTEVQRRERFEEGRLYRFLPDSQVVSLARKITVIFADLRGFTRTSEGGVSERELTHHLYEVFDPLAAIVEKHRGKIDKFTGDGVMITFGAARLTRQDELNALRTALALQEMMRALRTAGRTHFEMGISVHTGRAQVAHFIVDDHSMDHTVIGRNVNIAGRLSGSGKTQASGFDDEDWIGTPSPAVEKADMPARDVWVDEAGTLYNTGIVVSQDTVEELSKLVDCRPLAEAGGGGHQFFDEQLQRNVLLEYVGDAKFKGVGRSIAIYRLGLEDEQPTPSPRRP
ncbi:MAG: adenylate/guanylate cyclase domain-containing protein [candidate division NC10 bacterium]|nr:adenylate/guanylate cyclase domain-containing protein [candidate division NC10 bacterium]